MRFIKLFCLSLIFGVVSGQEKTLKHDKKEQEHTWAVQLINKNTSQAYTDAEANEFAEKRGLINLGQIGGLEGYYLFKYDEKHHGVEDSDSNSTEKREKHSLEKRQPKEIVEDDLLDTEHVCWFEYQEVKKRSKRSAIIRVPEDESDLGFNMFLDPLYPRQWHLRNDGQNAAVKGNDIQVVPVWARGINGSGVTVAVLDDGVDYTHPDIAPNWSNISSYDFHRRNRDPRPQDEQDVHGTRCAGEIAAAANDFCGVGVAFGAKIAGERVIGDSITDAIEAQALNYFWDINDIYSSSWGPLDDGAAADGPGILAQKALIAGVSRGRKGKGSIFVFASGNGGENEDNCNFDSYANSVYTVSIGAINHEDQFPVYGEQCSAHLAVTYSGGKGKGITTIDLGNKCTNKHSGTSAAAPLASGMIALMLQARPELGWRDVQQIIIDAAVVNDPNDPDWMTNGAQKKISHKYGFGKMNATALVDRALVHEFLPHPALRFTKKTDSNKKIPLAGGNQAGLISIIPVSQSELDRIGIASLEHVQVTVRIAHPERRQLTIKLNSPDGTPSILATRRVNDDSNKGFNPWTFMTIRNWGEKGVGDWILEVHDIRQNSRIMDEESLYKQGILISWELILHGTCDKSQIEEIEDHNGISKTCKSLLTQNAAEIPETLESEEYDSFNSSSSVLNMLFLVGAFVGSSGLTLVMYTVFRTVRDRWSRNRYKRAGLDTTGDDLESPMVDVNDDSTYGGGSLRFQKNGPLMEKRAKGGNPVITTIKSNRIFDRLMQSIQGGPDNSQGGGHDRIYSADGDSSSNHDHSKELSYYLTSPKSPDDDSKSNGNRPLSHSTEALLSGKAGRSSKTAASKDKQSVPTIKLIDEDKLADKRIAFKKAMTAATTTSMKSMGGSTCNIYTTTSSQNSAAPSGSGGGFGGSVKKIKKSESLFDISGSVNNNRNTSRAHSAERLFDSSTESSAAGKKGSGLKIVTTSKRNISMESPI